MIVTVRLSDELLEKVDALGKRSDVIRQALESWTASGIEKPAEPKAKTVERFNSPAAKTCPRCQKPLTSWSASFDRCIPCGNNWPVDYGK